MVLQGWRPASSIPPLPAPSIYLYHPLPLATEHLFSSPWPVARRPTQKARRWWIFMLTPKSFGATPFVFGSSGQGRVKWLSTWSTTGCLVG